MSTRYQKYVAFPVAPGTMKLSVGTQSERRQELAFINGESTQAEKYIRHALQFRCGESRQPQ